MPAIIGKKKKKVRRAVMSRDLLAPLVIGWSHIFFFVFSHLLLALAAAITGVLPHAPAVMKIIIITVRTASLQSHFQRLHCSTPFSLFCLNYI